MLILNVIVTTDISLHNHSLIQLTIEGQLLKKPLNHEDG